MHPLEVTPLAVVVHAGSSTFTNWNGEKGDYGIGTGSTEEPTGNFVSPTDPVKEVAVDAKQGEKLDRAGGTEVAVGAVKGDKGKGAAEEDEFLSRLHRSMAVAC